MDKNVDEKISIDIYAPIIPYESMGGIKLGTTIDELKDLLEEERVECGIHYGGWLVCKIGEDLELYFDLKDKKVFRIFTEKNYKGVVKENGIYVGMHENELVEKELSFEYDDFEEIWLSKKGIYVETDYDNPIVTWISIFIKEFESDDFLILHHENTKRIESVDENAPILAYVGLGGIELGSTVIELRNLIDINRTKGRLYGGKIFKGVIYNKNRCIDDAVEQVTVYIDIEERTVFKLDIHQNYYGKVFEKIGIGTSKEEMLKVEPTFEYDEEKRLWVTQKGVHIELNTDTDTVKRICIFTKDFEKKRFERYNW